MDKTAKYYKPQTLDSLPIHFEQREKTTASGALITDHGDLLDRVLADQIYFDLVAGHCHHHSKLLCIGNLICPPRYNYSNIICHTTCLMAWMA